MASCACYVQGGQFEITNIDEVSNAIDAQTDSIASVGGIAPLRFCHWAAPEWGDQGESWEKDLYQLALVAVATLNTLAQIKIAEKQFSLAKDYAKLAEDRLDRFRDRYAHLERAKMYEVGSEPIAEPDYTRARYAAESYTRAAFSSGNNTLATMRGRYRICMGNSLANDLAVAQAISMDDGANFNYRDEEHYAIISNDRRFNKRSSVLNLGRDNHAQSATYAQLASNTYAGLSNLANQGAQGAASLLGYLNERRETQYADAFSGTTSLTGSAGYQIFPGLFSGASLGPNSGTL